VKHRVQGKVLKERLERLKREEQEEQREEMLEEYLEKIGHEPGQPLRDEFGRFISREELIKFLEHRPREPHPEALKLLSEEFVQIKESPHVYELRWVWTEIGKNVIVIMGIATLIALLI
jgi:uncharacterized Zn finger protein